MNLLMFFKILKNIVESSVMCIKVGFTEYNEFAAKIEEILTESKRETVKEDPLLEMVLASVIGGMMLITHFQMIPAILIILIIHGCMYASLMCVIGICGFLMKIFLYMAGVPNPYLLMLPLGVYMIASVVFYAFRAIDEGFDKILKRDFYEIIKLILFGILIKIA